MCRGPLAIEAWLLWCLRSVPNPTSSLRDEIVLPDDFSGLCLPLLPLMVLDLHAMLELLNLDPLDLLRGQWHEVYLCHQLDVEED